MAARRKSNKVAEGVFLQIPVDRADEFWAVIADAGYPQSPEGVLAFILDDQDDHDPEELEIEEENPVDELITRANQWVKDNPEKAAIIRDRTKKVGGQLAAALKKML